MNKTNDPNSEGEIDRVIHEPSRLRIMAQLYVVESADFTFLLNQLGFTWGNLSSHLSKLEESGYVEVQKEFLNKKPRTILKLTSGGRKAFDDYRKAIDRVFKDLPK
ncbi:MAG: winged helix-turn-helix domain-containing protein [Candidatus Thorarchaeota archaeon]